MQGIDYSRLTDEELGVTPASDWDALHAAAQRHRVELQEQLEAFRQRKRRRVDHGTIQAQLEKRGKCRYGLRGAVVAVDGNDEDLGIVFMTYWGDPRTYSGFYPPLVIDLADGRRFHASRLHMRTRWPRVCC